MPSALAASLSVARAARSATGTCPDAGAVAASSPTAMATINP
jgi:hypothetical protein